MVKKILVPTDGSKTSTKALKYALDLAKQTGSSIILLSVADARVHIAQAVSSVTPMMEPLEDYMKESASLVVDAAGKLCRRKDVISKGIVRSGHPAEEILKEADRSKVDLIVMGSHGKSAARAAILGSITFSVIHRDMKYPVLVVRR